MKLPCCCNNYIPSFVHNKEKEGNRATITDVVANNINKYIAGFLYRKKCSTSLDTKIKYLLNIYVHPTYVTEERYIFIETPYRYVLPVI